MNTALKNKIIEEMEALGFTDMANLKSKDFQYYMAVYHGVLRMRALGKEAFDKSSLLRPDLKAIVYKLSESFKPV